MSPSKFSCSAQKTELELYLDEPIMNRTVNTNVHFGSQMNVGILF